MFEPASTPENGCLGRLKAKDIWYPGRDGDCAIPSDFEHIERRRPFGPPLFRLPWTPAYP
jgi:hypothetical protein